MRYDNLPTAATWLADTAAMVPIPGGRIAALKASLQNGGPPVVGVRGPNLKRIDQLLLDYEKAHSNMAKMNYLTLLDKAIRFWNQVNAGLGTMEMVALKEVVTRLLQVRLPNSRYNRAICLGYQVGCNYEKSTGIVHPSGPNSGLNTGYFRHSDDDQIDMETKCSNLWQAIVAAKNAIGNLPAMQDSDRTLKIFMAPEFYFRGRNGAYSPEIVSRILPKMKALGTGGNDYKNWLFIFGTAIASIETQETFCTTCTHSQNIKFERDPVNRGKTIAKCTAHPTVTPVIGTWGAEIQNVALIQHDDMTHLVAKEYVSHIDFRKHPTMPKGSVRRDDGTYLNAIAPQGSREIERARGPRAPIHNDERAGGCIFSIDGITIGLEICLDHGQGGSAGVWGFGRASDYAQIIQFSLIPSYGMNIERMNCRLGGFAFNVDGRGHGLADVAIRSQMGPVRPFTWVIAASYGSVRMFAPCRIPG